MLATTGTLPELIRPWTASTRTEATSPTSPRSTGSPLTTVPRRSAVNRPPSSPDIPTARVLARLIRPTRSRPTWPTRTIRTTSMASGLVTRRPPRNSETMPSRSSIAEICGPPPCTTTGCTPQRFMNTMSWAKACLSSSSTMALPPYLITTVLPA